jgi:hypothetical protein
MYKVTINADPEVVNAAFTVDAEGDIGVTFNGIQVGYFNKQGVFVPFTVYREYHKSLPKHFKYNADGKLVQEEQ